VVTLLFGVARRWYSAPELALGALVIPLVGAIYLSATLPAAAMNLQWPVAAALLGTILLLMGKAGTLKEIVWAAVTLLALPVLALLVPSTEFLWLGLSLSEALVLGSKAGVEPELILKVLGGGLAANKVMEMRGPNFLNHDFAPGFKIKLHRKDLAIVLGTAHEYGVSLPVTALVDQMFTTLVGAGKAELDHSALLTHLEAISGHVVGSDRG